MVLEHVEYEPEKNKAEEIKHSDKDIIMDALSLMQSAQITETQDPETTEPEETIEEENITPPVIDPNIYNGIPDPEPETTITEDKEYLQQFKDPEPNKAPMENDILKFCISAQYFKDIIRLQNTINIDGKIIFDLDKIYISGVDPAHIEMINQEIPTSNLEEYKINKKIELGFDYDKLMHIFKSIKKTDNLYFHLNTETNKVNMKIGFFDHNITLLDTAGMIPKIPNLELRANFILDTKLFYDFLVQASRITDYITITTNKDSVTLFAEGDIDKIKIKLNKEDLKEFYSFCDYELKSLFSVDYLVNTFRNLKSQFDNIKFYIDNDNPLKLEGNNKHSVKIFLAPRIESE